jgi:hypothetical protein
MNKMIKNTGIVLLLISTLFSCGSSNSRPATADSVNTAGNSGTGNVYFSCFADGAAISDNADGGIVDPVTGMLLNTGQNDAYTVGIRIPTDLKAGETCNSCKGFVHKKIKHEGGPTETRIYERVENIKLTLTSRSRGYAAGTFSFTVKLKEDSDTKIVVTDGKFGMNIINDN